MPTITDTGRYPVFATKAAFTTAIEQEAFVKGNNRDRHLQLLFQLSNTDTDNWTSASTSSITAQPTDTYRFPTHASKAAFMSDYEDLIFQKGANRDQFLQLLYQLGNVDTDGWTSDSDVRHDA